MAVFVKIAIANSGAVSITFNLKHCFEHNKKNKIKKTSQSYINACNCLKGIQNTVFDYTSNIRRIPINLCIIFQCNSTFPAIYTRYFNNNLKFQKHNMKNILCVQNIKVQNCAMKTNLFENQKNKKLNCWCTRDKGKEGIS